MVNRHCIHTTQDMFTRAAAAVRLVCAWQEVEIAEALTVIWSHFIVFFFFFPLHHMCLMVSLLQINPNGLKHVLKKNIMFDWCKMWFSLQSHITCAGDDMITWFIIQHESNHKLLLQSINSVGRISKGRIVKLYACN